MSSIPSFSNFDALPIAWQELTNNLRNAEYYVTSDAAHSALLARKALEEWVRWMFTNDEDLVDVKIYDDSLANLMHHQAFKDIIAPKFFAPLNIVRKLGNDANNIFLFYWICPIAYELDNKDERNV